MVWYGMMWYDEVIVTALSVCKSIYALVSELGVTVCENVRMSEGVNE